MDQIQIDEKLREMAFCKNETVLALFFADEKNDWLTTTEGLTILHLAAWVNNFVLLEYMMRSFETIGNMDYAGLSLVTMVRDMTPIHFAVVARSGQFLETAHQWNRHDGVNFVHACNMPNENTGSEMLAQALYQYDDEVSKAVCVRRGQKSYVFEDKVFEDKMDFARTTKEHATELACRALGLSPSPTQAPVQQQPIAQAPVIAPAQPAVAEIPAAAPPARAAPLLGKTPAVDAEAGNNDSSCTICMEFENRVALFPCGHQCLCIRCAKAQVEGFICPICDVAAKTSCVVFKS